MIRNAVETDKSKVLDFCKNTFSWGDYIADVWDGWKSKGYLFVLENNDKVVGSYNLSYSGKQVWIEGMRIHPDYRRKGFGTNLLSHAESIFGKKIFRFIVESENLASLALAKSAGYSAEEKWSLYLTTPKIEKSSAKQATSLSQISYLRVGSKYVDSWRWYSLEEDILKLIKNRRVLLSNFNSNNAIGVLSRYGDFPNILQLGYLDGDMDEMLEILKYTRHKAHEIGCEKIQVFCQGDTSLNFDFLEKRATFFLMKKDLTEKSINFEVR